MNEPRIAYLASSFRTPNHDAVKDTLRAVGYTVRDYREGVPGPRSSWWCKDATATTTPREARSMMRRHSAQTTLWRNVSFVREAHLVVAVQPFGVSTAAEIALAVGLGKRTAVLLDAGPPELMLGVADMLCVSIDELAAFAARTDVAPCLWCWFVDHSDNSDEGGYYVDAHEAEQAEVAVRIASARFLGDAEDGEAPFDRARLVRTPYPAAEMNGRDVYGEDR